MAEQDWDGWKLITERLVQKFNLSGMICFVTNTKILKEGIEKGITNAILIKLNPDRTLTETLDAIEMAKRAGYTAIVSHRSGETRRYDHRRPRCRSECRADQDRFGLSPPIGSVNTINSSESRRAW